jgi:hypothetical protein
VCVGQKVLSSPSADSFAVGRRQKAKANFQKENLMELGDTQVESLTHVRLR